MKLTGPNRGSRLKNAILASFFAPAHDVVQTLERFSERDWRRALYWLDMNGLALYLLDHLTRIGIKECLPTSILNGMQLNYEQNRERTCDLFTEAVALSHAFTKENVSFALLKGVTLPPEAVPNSAARFQMDIDILVRESDAIAARRVVLGFGYVPETIKKSEWAFTTGTNQPMSINSLYRVRPQRMVELHLLAAGDEDSASGFGDRLTRSQLRRIQNVELPVLSLADIFVQQAIHIFKHLCSENTRAAWLLEYWRHVEARSGDLSFWTETRAIAEREPGSEVAIGAVTQLASELFGQAVPQELSCWPLDRVPRTVCLWNELYGRRILLADPPGNKFYLFLHRQFAAEAEKPQSRWYRALLPFHWWPAKVTRGHVGECLGARLTRYRIEAAHLVTRLRFHMRTSIPFMLESRRWKRLTEAAR